MTKAEKRKESIKEIVNLVKNIENMSLNELKDKLESYEKEENRLKQLALKVDKPLLKKIEEVSEKLKDEISKKPRVTNGVDVLRTSSLDKDKKEQLMKENEEIVEQTLKDQKEKQEAENEKIIEEQNSKSNGSAQATQEPKAETSLSSPKVKSTNNSDNKGENAGVAQVPAPKPDDSAQEEEPAPKTGHPTQAAQENDVVKETKEIQEVKKDEYPTRYQKQIKNWKVFLSGGIKHYCNEDKHSRYIKYIKEGKYKEIISEISDDIDKEYRNSTEDKLPKSRINKIKNFLFGIMDLQEYERTVNEIKKLVEELENYMREIYNLTPSETDKEKIRSFLRLDNNYYDQIKTYSKLEYLLNGLLKCKDNDVDRVINKAREVRNKAKKLNRIIKKELALDDYNKLKDKSCYNSKDFGRFAQEYKQLRKKEFKKSVEELEAEAGEGVVVSELHDILFDKKRIDNENSKEVSDLLYELKEPKDREEKIVLYRKLINQLIKDGEYFKAEKKLVELKKLLTDEQIEAIEIDFQYNLGMKHKEVSKKLNGVKGIKIKDENDKKNYVDLSLALFELKSLHTKSDSDLLDAVSSLMELKNREMTEEQRSNYEFNLNSTIGKMALSNTCCFKLDYRNSVKFIKLLRDLGYKKLSENVTSFYKKTHRSSSKEKNRKSFTRAHDPCYRKNKVHKED